MVFKTPEEKAVEAIIGRAEAISPRAREIFESKANEMAEELLNGDGVGEPLGIFPGAQGGGVTISEFQAAMRDRQKLYPTCKSWTLADWFMALVGEAGELANILKKVRRGDTTLAEALPAVSKEMADVQAYLACLADFCGIDLEAATVEKFNEVSEKIGSTIFLPAEFPVDFADVIPPEYENMTREELIETAVAHDAHHNEHHQKLVQIRAHLEQVQCACTVKERYSGHRTECTYGNVEAAIELTKSECEIEAEKAQQVQA